MWAPKRCSRATIPNASRSSARPEPGSQEIRKPRAEREARRQRARARPQSGGRAVAVEPRKIFLGGDEDERRPAHLRQMLERLERKTGVQPVHAHRFRHTFAVQALKNGMDIYTLSRILGHATIAMSARYLRALQEEEAAEMHARIFNQRGRR